MGEQLVGTVSHFFTNAKVAAIELIGELRVGDTIHIVGHTSDFSQEVGSMQIEHQAVDRATRGDHIGVAVKSKARQNDNVYRVD